jgi:hypothetical protein
MASIRGGRMKKALISGIGQLPWSAASSGDELVSLPLKNLWKRVIGVIKDHHESTKGRAMMGNFLLFPLRVFVIISLRDLS